jgi:hypothetical protein
LILHVSAPVFARLAVGLVGMPLSLIVLRRALKERVLTWYAPLPHEIDERTRPQFFALGACIWGLFGLVCGLAALTAVCELEGWLPS